MGGYLEIRSFKGKRKKNICFLDGLLYFYFMVLRFGIRLEFKEYVVVGNGFCVEYSMVWKIKLFEII